MKASDLVRAVSDRHQASIERLAGRAMQPHEVEQLVGLVVDGFFDAVGSALAGGAAVVVRRFGRFERHQRKPRTIRPGGLKPPVVVPARPTVGFAPADALKTLVRERSNGVHERQPAD